MIETESNGFFSFFNSAGETLSGLVDDAGSIANGLAQTVGRGADAWKSLSDAIHGSPSPASIPAPNGPPPQGTPTAAPPSKPLDQGFVLALVAGVLVAVLLLRK